MKFVVLAFIVVGLLIAVATYMGQEGYRRGMRDQEVNDYIRTTHPEWQVVPPDAFDQKIDRLAREALAP